MSPELIPDSIVSKFRCKSSIAPLLNTSREMAIDTPSSARIESVGLIADDSEIAPPVVNTVSIDVVDLHSIRNVAASHEDPRQSMRVISSVVQANHHVMRPSVFFANNSGELSSVRGIANIHPSDRIEMMSRPVASPKQLTRIGIVYQSLPKIFNWRKRIAFSFICLTTISRLLHGVIVLGFRRLVQPNTERAAEF